MHSFPKKTACRSYVQPWLVTIGGGWWRLVVVGGGWWLVIDGWWQLAVVGSWRLVAAGGWRRLAVVGGCRRLAVGGGWWLPVGGPLGRSLRAPVPLVHPPLMSGRSHPWGGGGRSPSDGPPYPQFECNPKKIAWSFLCCSGPVTVPPPPGGGGIAKGGGGSERRPQMGFCKGISTTPMKVNAAATTWSTGGLTQWVGATHKINNAVRTET